MSTNQKYSARIHSRRQLTSIDNHLKACLGMLNNLGIAYQEALPQVSEACINMITMIDLVKGMAAKVRENL